MYRLYLIEFYVAYTCYCYVVSIYIITILSRSFQISSIYFSRFMFFLLFFDNFLDFILNRFLFSFLLFFGV